MVERCADKDLIFFLIVTQRYTDRYRAGPHFFLFWGYRVFAVADLLLLREAHNTHSGIDCAFLDPERKREKEKKMSSTPAPTPGLEMGPIFIFS
jgi:hypothetical protein